MRRPAIEEENRRMLERQRQFRIAADVVTEAWMAFAEVQAVAVIGSVAKPLWKEVPRFREFRHKRIELWHECGDLDLALWISSQERLREVRRAGDLALRDAYLSGAGMSVANHQVDVFLFEPASDRYLGRLCKFNECPKEKRDCLAPGCGAIPFNRVFPEFTPHADILAPASYSLLYRRGVGRIRSALDLPTVAEHDAGGRAGPGPMTVAAAAGARPRRRKSSTR
jgi:hypothetical protein